MEYEITTATGKVFSVQRCYVSDVDGVLNIGIANETIANVATVFSNPEETKRITLSYVDGDKIGHYDGYTFISLITYESNINGAYLVLRRP